MLETKRVNAYGRRGTRIIQVSGHNRGSNDSPVKRRNDQENAVSTSPPSARKLLTRKRKVHGISTSPRGSPKSADIFGLRTKKTIGNSAAFTPQRRPLGVKNLAVANSPSIVYLGHKPPPHTPNVRNTTFAPYMDSDVVLIEPPPTVLNNATKKAKKVRPKLAQLTNREVSEEDESDTIRPPQKRAMKRVIFSDDDDTDEGILEITFRRPTRGAKVDPIVISDDSDAPSAQPERETQTHHEKDSLPGPSNEPEEQRIPQTRGYHRRQAENPHQVLHAVPDINQHSDENSKKSEELVKRQLPKVKHTEEKRKVSGSTSKLEDSFTGLNISKHIEPESLPNRPIRRASKALSGPRDKPAFQHGQYLNPLLHECGQTSPYSFNGFIETFPSDAVHGNLAPEPLTFRKIGEASFSEVFAIGNVVLKVIPLSDEDSAPGQPFGEDVDIPQLSDSKDVLQEIVVTRTLGQTCHGFIKLLKTYIVIGEYPSLLLSLWDEFNDKKPSENIRPDMFPSSQAYALLVLPNGGSDLETYMFPLKTGWQQACSVFWQTAKALAEAEGLVSFEHRDLHWGQILVKAVGTAHKAKRTSSLRGRGRAHSSDIAMNHPNHGVVATIIDLGLARMEVADNTGISVHWTPFDELIFQGEGDYQFDIYRMMRQVHGDRWDKYKPVTNVMWLHYLSLKLIRAKRLRPPNLRGVTTVSNELGEKQCYECLVEMEALLGSSIPQLKSKTKRGGTMKGMFQNAGDVVNYAQEKGWLLRS